LPVPFNLIPLKKSSMRVPVIAQQRVGHSIGKAPKLQRVILLVAKSRFESGERAQFRIRQPVQPGSGRLINHSFNQLMFPAGKRRSAENE
jgi:hypothetical protein